MSDLLRIATAGSVDDGKSTLIGRLLLDSKSLLDDSGRGRPRARHRRPARRARAGHHDRRRLPVLRHAAALVHPRRHARPRPLHAQHGHRRVDRRPRAGADRRAQGAARAVAAARVPGGAARHPAPRGVREQDGPGRVRGGALPRDRGRRSARSARSWASSTCAPCRSRRSRATTSSTPRRGWPGTTRRRCSRSWRRVEIDRDRNLDDVRFPVQWTVRAGDYRGYAGRVAGGVLAVGDEVVVLPSGSRSRVAAIDTPAGPVARGRRRRWWRRCGSRTSSTSAAATSSSRPGDQPEVARELDATVCWMVEAPARVGARYLLKHTTRRVRANIASIDAAGGHLLVRDARPADELGLNDIGRITLRTAAPVLADAYAANRATGAFILIDERTHDTVAAGMVEAARAGRAAEVEHSPDIRWHPSALERSRALVRDRPARRDRLADRAARVGQVDDRGGGRARAGRVRPLRLPARRRQPPPRALGRPRLRSRLALGEHPPRGARRAAVRRRGRGGASSRSSPPSARTG